MTTINTLEGEQVVIEQGDDDLDSFFQEKDKRKKERLAKKKAAKAERERQDRLEWGDEYDQHTGTDQPGEEAEELTNQEALIHRPEDDEWIDPEREFGATRTKNKSDDKLLLLVAPSANKLQDLSDISLEKNVTEKKSDLNSGSSGNKTWSKIETTDAVNLAEENQSQVITETAQQPDSLPSEVEAPEKKQDTGVFVPPHLRSREVTAPARRTQSPISRPVEDTGVQSSYIPPALRAQQQSSGPPPSVLSGRPAGSGLGGLSGFQRPKPKPEAPNLMSADEFPSLG